jgi:PhnB protein
VKGTVKPVPAGYHTVTPYLVVENASALIEFMIKVFGAQEVLRMPQEDGRIIHAEVRIGDSVVMMSDALNNNPPMPTVLHIYLEDTDSAFQRALDAGAIALREPEDQFYGDRTAGVQDVFGNQWWIATHIEDVPAGEHRELL